MTPGPRDQKIVNLCFHGIGTPERTLEPDEELYWVDPAAFEELLSVAERNPLVRLSFDDGNASDASIALPALAERGLSASFFVIADRLDQPGSLSRDDVRVLSDAGMTIGSHGLKHRPWRSLDEASLRDELHEAPKIIAEAAGAPVTEAACPFGSYDRRVLRALKRHGFARVYTVDRRLADPNAWLQPRYVVRRSDAPDDVERYGSDSFLQAARCAIKRWR